MNDREYKKQKRRAERVLLKWQEALGFRWWKCRFDFSRQHKERTDDEAKAGKEILADIFCQWEYAHLTITVYLPAIEDLDNDELEHAIVHEFAHALVNEMRDYAKDEKHEERVVENLAKAIRWAYQTGKDDKPRADNGLKRKRKKR